MRFLLGSLGWLAVLPLGGARAAEAPAQKVLVVEQRYNVIRTDQASSRDVRQILYLAPGRIRIDEFAKPGPEPTETVFVDRKARRIVTLHPERGKWFKRSESFSERRKRIEARKDKVRRDLRVLKGAQQAKTRRLFKALLDAKRTFRLEKKGSKFIGGTKTDHVRVVDDDDRDYVPLEAYLHPKIILPYDSAEMLYLLQIIGEKMSKFLKKKSSRKYFRRLPMEMNLDLAAGGDLHTQVTRVGWKDRAELEKKFIVPDVPEKKRTGPSKNGNGETAPD